MNFLEQIAATLRKQGASTQIIIINVVVFLTLNVVGEFSKANLLDFLAVPIGGHQFLFRFWTIFTYTFTHFDFWHLFSNMLIFYFLSQVFYIAFQSKKLYYVYFMSGLAGAALILCMGLLFPNSFNQPYLFGASSAILGVGAVMVVYTPNYKMMLFGVFGIAYKYLYLIIFLINTVMDISINTGGKISHMGGAAFGLMYAWYLKKGIDLLNFSFLNKKQSPLKVVSHNKDYVKPDQAAQKSDENRMNEILEKISKSGYDSLTRTEKEDLFKLSQKK